MIPLGKLVIYNDKVIIAHSKRASRTFDNYTLNRWELCNRELKCTFEEVRDHDPSIRKPFIKKANEGRYVPPSRAQEIQSGDEYVKEEANYSLESNDDFPALGS